MNPCTSVRTNPILSRPIRPFQSFRTRPSLAHARRLALPVRAGLFDNVFGASRSSGGKSKAELTERLLDQSKAAGSKPSASVNEQITELAQQLRQYRPRAPTRSPLFWGDYKVIFSTNPQATGGPVLRSGPGQLVFGGQDARQTLLQPGTLINSVKYKALGLLPGTTTQQGTLAILDGNRYEVYLQASAMTGGEAVTRRFEVLYLDEILRIVRFLPEDEAKEPVLFVFQRIKEEEQGIAENEEGPSLQELQPKQGGTRRQAVGVTREQNSGDKQVKELARALIGWQEKSRSSAQQLRDKERGAGSSTRGLKPAQAQVDRVRREAEGLEQQLAAAVEAAQAAEARYLQAASELRQAEKASR